MIRRARGQSLVEFALVAPIMIFIIMGLIDFSYYIYSYSELENVTRRASEYMSKAARQGCKDEARNEAAKSVVLSEINTANIDIDFNPSTPELGGTVTASISNYPVRFLTPVGKSLFGNAKLNFSSQRVILSISPPYSNVCS